MTWNLEMKDASVGNMGHGLFKNNGQACRNLGLPSKLRFRV